MNIIQLLNCFYREDLVTDLMANLINTEKKFANWFVEHVCQVSGSYKMVNAHTRVGLGKGIGTPDLIIELKNDSAAEKILVIENKLGALEGYEQTNRYASDQGKEKLFKALKISPVPIEFFFLTLDPFTLPKNTQFHKRDYQHFVDMKWDTLIQDPTAVLVMKDFSSYLKSFYAPILNVDLKDQIEKATTGLDSLQRKLLWIQVFQQSQSQFPESLKMHFGEVEGYGRNSAVFLFQKEEWKQNEFNGKELQANSINIHFEVTVNLVGSSPGKVSSFSVHYEPNPYKSKKTYEGIPGYEKYTMLRSKRTKAFHQSVLNSDFSNEVSLRNGSNSILFVPLNDHTTFEGLIEELLQKMKNIEPYIDFMLQIK
ncbi:hypothetical protein [Bacillus smithii]|uniref:hypothetical protein n=1 Tax=Bacillus smithii TaxID=1479 RepID=UPI0022E97682|nr:hypothetical protein [Bacillus smithii]